MVIYAVAQPMSSKGFNQLVDFFYCIPFADQCRAIILEQLSCCPHVCLTAINSEQLPNQDISGRIKQQAGTQYSGGLLIFVAAYQQISQGLQLLKAKLIVLIVKTRQLITKIIAVQKLTLPQPFHPPQPLFCLPILLAL